jgi:hypothetical protein
MIRKYLAIMRDYPLDRPVIICKIWPAPMAASWMDNDWVASLSLSMRDR